jgi:hypothetical protein
MSSPIHREPTSDPSLELLLDQYSEVVRTIEDLRGQVSDHSDYEDWLKIIGQLELKLDESHRRSRFVSMSYMMRRFRQRIAPTTVVLLSGSYGSAAAIRDLLEQREADLSVHQLLLPVSVEGASGPRATVGTNDESERARTELQGRLSESRTSRNASRKRVQHARERLAALGQAGARQLARQF